MMPKMARAVVDASGPGSESPSCLDGFLQLLRRTEGDLLARLDLDRLARCRIAAHAGGALPDLQDAETTDANPVALLQVFHDEIDHAAEDGLSLLFRKLVAFGDVCREVLQCNGRCSRLGWSGRHGYSSPFVRHVGTRKLCPSHKRFSRV